MTVSPTNRIKRLYRWMLPLPVRDGLYILRHPSSWQKRVPELLSRICGPIICRKLRRWKDYYAGHRCFIMGNGPSLNETPLHLLKHEYVWGFNKCYLLFDRIQWRPSFYTAVDTRVVPDIAPQIRALTQELPETEFFLPLHFWLDGTIQAADNVQWYPERRKDRANLPDGMFTRDPVRWVASVNTVTIAAMQLAVYMGFDPIYLIGCDTSYTIPETVEIADEDSDKLTATQNDDPNHFDPGYFGKDSKFHDPHVDRMIFHYEQAKRICDRLRVDIFNATIGGDLEVFPRVKFATLFDGKD